PPYPPPKLLPSPPQPSAHKNIRVLHCLLIPHPIAVPRMSPHLARRKIPLQKLPRVPRRNHRLRPPRPIPPLPRRIHSAYRPRQSIFLPIQIQRPHLPIIPRQNSHSLALLRRQSIPHPRHRLHKLRPANLLRKPSIHLRRQPPPPRSRRRNRQRHRPRHHHIHHQPHPHHNRNPPPPPLPTHPN